MTIQFSDMQVEYKQFLADVSKAVAKMVRKDLKVHDDLLSTAQAAKVLGITPDRLRHKKDKYPHLKQGDGKKQERLLFLREGLLR